ncbi:interleukin-17 receptor E-like protein isoform X2 [Engraulis encrasicolus]|uniref:interleukin-17 receptor E-like protein isoform X2 n=1 Tax=Engraulis encrasicolus TaxID=184585 RepID=UPI002FCF0356
MRSTLLLMLQMLDLYTYLSHGTNIQHVQHCGTHCTQGLHCKTKSYSNLSLCKKPPAGLQSKLSLGMSISTVMRCTGHQQCSLQLQVNSSLTMNERVKGVTICAVAAGTIERCRTHNFLNPAQKLSGQQVEVQDNCFEVGVGQDVHVSVKTVPEFCHLWVSKTYSVPAGKIAYQLDSERKELSVSVTDMLEDADYNLRLCHKGYICRGIDTQTLIKKEDPEKKATLRYTRPLPCLCIEGWSSVVDAPRVQVCPFKKNMEELWSGVAFNSAEQTLSWEPACQTEVAVSLCQNTEQSGCHDLANASQSVTRGKVLFSKVEPHPQLCMKFSTKTGSWIRCPFAGSDCTAWHIDELRVNGKTQLVVTSKNTPTLLLSLCTRTGPLACEEHKDVIIVNVTKPQMVVPKLDLTTCGQNCCIQARRIDVKYAAKVLLCDFKSPDIMEATAPLVSSRPWQSVWVVAPAVGVLTALLVSTLLVGAAITAITVYQKRSTKRACHVTASQHNTGLMSTHLVTPGSAKQFSPQNMFVVSTHCYYPTTEDAPHFENSEKTNLLNWVKKDSMI